MEYVTLANGVKMPQLGYGVYQVTKEECERCVSDALSVGYRHIDTAQSYFNEEEVGNAIKKSGIPREELFITTKVWIEHYGYEECRKSVLESLRKLQLDYIDLMLLHQPFADYYGAWRALEELYAEGKLRAIGVSNFYPDRLVDLCALKYGVVHEAWAPFGEGRGGLFTDPILQKIGAKYGKTPAQVILRWHLQRGIVVIPKSTHKERMAENFNVFDFTLSDENMKAIAALDKEQSSFFSHTDPNMVEWFVKIVEERKGATEDNTKKNW